MVFFTMAARLSSACFTFARPVMAGSFPNVTVQSSLSRLQSRPYHHGHTPRTVPDFERSVPSSPRIVRTSLSSGAGKCICLLPTAAPMTAFSPPLLRLETTMTAGHTPDDTRPRDT